VNSLSFYSDTSQLFLLSPTFGNLAVTRQALKGITFAFVAFLFSCQRTGLAERAARLPNPFVRVKRNVSNALRRGRIPADPDTWTTRLLLELERSGLPERRRRGAWILGPARDLVNFVAADR
jgi:hypothetical protein